MPAHELISNCAQLDPLLRKDIPQFSSLDGWKNIPIKESYQPLVSLNAFQDNFPICVIPQYKNQQIPGALDNMLLRKEAAERLLLSSKLLPDGYKFVVFDAYRPLEVQQSIFTDLKNILCYENPTKNDAEITLMTETYVSFPSSNPLFPSPHTTGGAIDLSICDESGKLLDMGTPFDSFDIDSRTNPTSKCSQLVYDNRKLLYNIMTYVGFTNYPDEWWHYDFGNQFWGKIKNRTAKYGLATTRYDIKIPS